jgi:hypothetical protein
MDTEINQNTIIGHIAGLTDDTKNALYDIFKKSQLFKLVEIIDVDLITTKIIEDTNMEQLFGKYEYYIERSKDSNLSNVENKNSLTKAKNLEKKMFQYWKAKMEYYINKLVNNSKKKIILIGYLSFFKNHRIYINLDIVSKFFLKVNYNDHAKTVIKYNLEHCKDDIIDGNFDLNFLNIDFLIKKRIQLQNIYTKISYIVMNLNSIINTIELNCQTNIPDILYYASFVKYEKKIPIMTNLIQVYSQEWLALSSILLSSDNINKINDDIPNNIEKGLNKNGKPFINITRDQSKKLNKIGYIYEITKTEYFLPYPTKTNVYKYFTAKPVKINRALVIDNILKQLKELNIIINID